MLTTMYSADLWSCSLTAKRGGRNQREKILSKEVQSSLLKEEHLWLLKWSKK